MRQLSVLTGGADKLPYFSGTDAMSQADLSAFGRTLIDDAAAVNARTTLGLVIGTDVQAQDTELQALAGLASAADQVPYFTGSGAAALATMTAQARSLLDDTTQAAQRATLGLDTGNSPSFTDLTLSGNLTVNGARVFVGGERTEFADNYSNLNANYTADAAQSVGLVANYDPTATTSAIAAGGFVAGVAATSNPTVEVAATTGFAAGDVIRVQGSTSNDGFYEVNALLATPARLQIKGIGTVAAVEDWSGNQFAAEAGAGNVYKVAVSVIRSGTDGLWEVGKGSAVPFTYQDLPDGGPAAVAAITTVDAGSAAAAGTAVTWARGDHEHAVTTGAAVALDAGSASAEGAGAALARAAHTHAISSAAPGAAGVATASGVGVATSFARSDHTHQSNTAAGAIAPGDAAAIGTSGEPARADHRHSIAVATAVAIGGAAGAGVSTSFSRADHQHGGVPVAAGDDFGSATLPWDLYSRERIVDQKAKTAAYTVAAGDYVILADPTTASFTVTLPTAVGIAGRVLVIKHSSGSANSVTVDGNAAETLDGALTQVLNARSSITIVSDNANWHIL